MLGRMSRGGSTLGSVAGVLVAATLGAPAPALAQAAIRWDAPCGERATFAGQVAELGGSVDGFDVDVTVREAEAGRFHGRLTIRRDAQPLVTRELDDEIGRASCRERV